MIEISRPEQITLRAEPCPIFKDSITPTLKVIDLERVGDFYKIKIEAKNLVALSEKYTLSPDDMKDGYGIYYDCDVHDRALMDAIFYMRVPWRYFSFLANDCELPYIEEEFEIEPIEYQIDNHVDSEEMDNWGTADSWRVKLQAKENFAKTLQHKIFYTISLK